MKRAPERGFLFELDSCKAQLLAGSRLDTSVHENLTGSRPQILPRPNDLTTLSSTDVPCFQPLLSRTRGSSGGFVWSPSLQGSQRRNHRSHSLQANRLERLELPSWQNRKPPMSCSDFTRPHLLSSFTTWKPKETRGQFFCASREGKNPRPLTAGGRIHVPAQVPWLNTLTLANSAPPLWEVAPYKSRCKATSKAVALLGGSIRPIWRFGVKLLLWRLAVAG